MPQVRGQEAGPDHLGFPGENFKKKLNHPFIREKQSQGASASHGLSFIKFRATIKSVCVNN
jgi:hypothetical protein